MYLPFPAAYRSLSRPSSAPSAKAFALRPSSLDLFSRLKIPLSSRIILSNWFFRQLQFFYPNFTLLKLYFAFLPLLSRLYSVFKVLLVILPDDSGGLKWVRTIDLALIRRAL